MISTAPIDTVGVSHLSVTKNTALQELSFYQNGIQIGSTLNFSNNPNGGGVSVLNIGRSIADDGIKYIDASIDEVRISDDVRSSHWLRTHYNNVNSPSTFYTEGNQQNTMPCTGPAITICQPNTTVNTTTACQHTLLDYTTSITAIDLCSTGTLSHTQTPSPGTLLDLGNNTITITVTDGLDQDDVCSFVIFVALNLSPTIVNCGQLLINESTTGQTNSISNFSCGTTPTIGKDKFYQFSIPTGSYWLEVALKNVIDNTNSELTVSWNTNTCALSPNCDGSETFNLSTGKFDNGTNSFNVLVQGSETYNFILDSDHGDIDTYDITFNCLT